VVRAPLEETTVSAPVDETVAAAMPSAETATATATVLGGSCQERANCPLRIWIICRLLPRVNARMPCEPIANGPSPSSVSEPTWRPRSSMTITPLRASPNAARPAAGASYA